MKSNELNLKMQKMTWRSLALGGTLAVAGVGLFFWIGGRPERDGVPGPLRSVLEANGKLWARIFDPGRIADAPPPPKGKKMRINGDEGLDAPIDVSKWRLKVYVEDKLVKELSLVGLAWLPRTSTATEFRCIEGWSEEISYEGIQFGDFLKAYGIPSHYRYVGLETPDQGYYVSIDMESMLHNQTLLADRINGESLSQQQGAPLRLLIPVKYGIKSLKRIGSIRLSDTRPRDFWAEQGYDWYAGL